MGMIVAGTAMRNEFRKPNEIELKADTNFVKDGVKGSKFHHPPTISGRGRNAAIVRPTNGNSHPIAKPHANR